MENERKKMIERAEGLESTRTCSRMISLIF
jgi:hypothetical protein